LGADGLNARSNTRYAAAARLDGGFVLDFSGFFDAFFTHPERPGLTHLDFTQ
jgi:hypothetical protein